MPDDLRRGALSRRRRAADLVAKAAIWLLLLVAVIPLGLVIFFVVGKGAAS